MPPRIPSRAVLPQFATQDRRRARQSTLRIQRTLYGYETDTKDPDSPNGLTLPPFVRVLPPGEAFSLSRKASLLVRKQWVKVNMNLAKLAAFPGDPRTFLGYARLLQTLWTPRDVQDRWTDDEVFAQQRLTGANPLQIRRLDKQKSKLPELLAAAATRGLDHWLALDGRLRVDQQRVPRDEAGAPMKTLDCLATHRRVFVADYTLLADPTVQAKVPAHYRLAPAVGVFFAAGDGSLHPLAIALDLCTCKCDHRPDPEVERTRTCACACACAYKDNCFAPPDGEAAWLYARCHLESADSHFHEAIHHLMATHLLSEVFAVATARQLHPEHPIAQLLTPHFTANLAINTLARSDILAPGGPIDEGMAAGATGVLNLIRLVWKDWNEATSGLPDDLAARGVDDPRVLRHYLFRDDALRHWAALEDYVSAMVDAWYPDDAHLLGDIELQDWASELASVEGGNVPGFPPAITDVAQLKGILTRVIYRASVGHASTNNGQFDRYGFVPNAPGAMRSTANPRGLDRAGLWRLFPERHRAFAQLSMAWVLSWPTRSNLLRMGEGEAFAPEVCPEAALAVGVYRRRMRELSADIGARNERLVANKRAPYTYLDPLNVSLSAEV